MWERSPRSWPINSGLTEGREQMTEYSYDQMQKEKENSNVESNALIDDAFVSSSTASSVDIGSKISRFQHIKCNLATGFYADNLYACQNSPKQLKKLNFVVCSERSLEIHESEKSYRRKKHAKIIIDLSTVFSITQRTNEKVKPCLMLTTPEQTFYLRAPIESATSEWYTLLFTNIHTSRSLVQGRQISLNDYPEDVWDVTVTQRPKLFRKIIDSQMQNLVMKDKRAFGRKRLCFFPHSVVLVQLHSELQDIATHPDRDPEKQDPDNYFYFARPFISFYGCQGKFFFIKTSTSAFGTCEVVMECDSLITSAEIYNKFKLTAQHNVEIHEKPWQQLFHENGDDDDEYDEKYYQRPKKTTDEASSLDNDTFPTLEAATAYCAEESPKRKSIKEVRFKNEDQVEMHPVKNVLQDVSIEDGDVGNAIAADIIRMSTSKPPPKKPSHEISNPFNGLISSIKKKFHDKLPSSEEEGTQEPVAPKTQGFKEQVAELKQWAENRASLVEDETEDSGGTLKIDDPALLNPDIPMPLSVEEQRKLRRDALLSNAVKKYNKQTPSKNETEQQSIEMVEMSSRLTDASGGDISTESSSCAYSTTESESDSNKEPFKKETKLDSNSSTSALDSCISNTSEDVSTSSSVSNVEYTWKPIMKLLNAKKLSLDTHSCAGRVNDDVSDMSADSCYSSLTNNGYQPLPKSHSLSQMLPEATSEVEKKSVSVIRSTKAHHVIADNIKEHLIEPMEEAEKFTLKPIKSSSDLMSDIQQESLRSQLLKIDDPKSLAAAIRQRAASLGNKSWAVTPLGQSIRHQRHRQDCKRKKKENSSSSRLSEEQPLIDPRHSSISSQSENSCSYRKHAAAARMRLSQALLLKNPRRSNMEDLAELTFMNATENSSGGGSLGSMNGVELQRETIQAFGGTNKALIPTTRYSEGSTSSFRQKSARCRRKKKAFELEVVQCFLDLEDFEPISTPTQKAASTSSHESVEDKRRYSHGKRSHKNHHNQSCTSQDSNEHRHSCRRKHRASCQEAIAEEDAAQQTEVLPLIDSATTTVIPQDLMENKNSDDSLQLNSAEASEKSDDQAGELNNLDLLNNNPNPVTIFA